MENEWNWPAVMIWEELRREAVELPDFLKGGESNLIWQADVFKKWMDDNGEAMKDRQLARIKQIPDERRKSFQRSSDFLLLRIIKRSALFRAKQQAGYFDYLFEVAYLFDDRIEAFCRVA